MARVKACNASKIKSVLQDFPGEFTKTPTMNCIVTCATAWFPATNVFFVDSHQKTSKHQKALSRFLLIQ